MANTNLSKTKAKLHTSLISSAFSLIYANVFVHFICYIFIGYLFN